MFAIDPTQATPVDDVKADAPVTETKAATETVVATSTEAVKAARYEAANQALEQAAKDATAKTIAEANAAAAAEKAKADEVVSVAKLSTDLAEAKAKADLLGADAKRAAKLDKVAELVKAGKHYDAIQELSDLGLSFDAAVQQLVNPGAEPPVAAKPDDKPVDPEVAKMRAELDAVNKRLADADAALAANAKEAGRRTVVEHVKTNAKDFPYLAANEDWVTAALASAEPDYAEAIKANNGQDLSMEAKNDLVIKALAKAEASHAATAAKYSAVKPGGIPTKNPIDVSKVTQPTLTLNAPRAAITPAVKTGKAASLEELKRARRTAAN